MNQRNIIVLINPNCHQGQGWKRWTSIKDEVRRSLGSDVSTVVLEAGLSLAESLRTMVIPGQETILISAGGDGTVNTLVNAVFNLQHPHNIADVIIGAIGLGSSNDFLKPFGARIGEVPVRIDVDGPVARWDAGRAIYLDGSNLQKTTYFVVNASLGVTASANWNFNNPDGILRWLKATSSRSAIIYTALKAIMRYRNANFRLLCDEDELILGASNIHILKIPYVSGNFRYDGPIAPDDGKLSLNICRNMTRMELMWILYHLSQGKFLTGRKTMSKMVTGLTVHSEKHIVFECDGETTMAKKIHISVVPQALNVLTR